MCTPDYVPREFFQINVKKKCLNGIMIHKRKWDFLASFGEDFDGQPQGIFLPIFQLPFKIR